MAGEKNSRTLFILADGTGDTAEQVARAALTQFRDIEVKTETFTRIRSKKRIREVIERAKAERAFVIYTIIDEQHCDYIEQLAMELRVEIADVIGDLILKIGVFFDAQPLNVAGVKQQLDAQYFRRIEAVEFAVKCDDGQSLPYLKHADMVLVGLSRTSKTPLSMFLAHKGYKVANVPLVQNIEPPKELFEIDQNKITGLIIDISSLFRVRRERLQHLGLPPDAEYASREKIAEELRWSRDFYARHPSWPVLDTSIRAVEETAAEIIRVQKSRT